MKRKYFFAIIVSILSLCACPNVPAQTTQVSATVLDPGGKPYQNCTGSANFVPSPTATTVPTISGSTFQTIVPIAACDSFGKFSMTLVDNNQVSDGHTGAQASQWSFFIQSANVCFVGQKVSFSTTLTITGASQDISAALTAAAASLPSCGGGGGSGPALQTNGTPNTLQTVLNLKSGNNISLAADGSGGVTLTTNPGTPSGCLQYDLAGIFTGASGLCTSDGNSLSIKGPIPFASLDAFTRATNSSTGFSTTATISLGAPTTATLGSAVNFQTGDGITIQNAGPAITINAPAAPTVTPNTIAVAGTALGGGNYTATTVVNGATGASTYLYSLIARDPQGGFTAPGSATTISTGPSTLGSFSCAISSESRSGRTITVNFSSACAGAVVGAGMLIAGTPPNPPTLLSGYYTIKTVNSSTQVLVDGPFDSTGFGWNSSDSNANQGTNSSTGGTAFFFNSNHLSWTLGSPAPWEFYVCAERPGDVTFKLIGVTKPTTTTSEDIQFDDYGSPMMDGQTYPPYITNTVCNGVTGQNDPLTATITNLVGTTATLDTAATNAVTGATALFDNGPGLVKAANSVSVGTTPGTLLIPASGANGFVINSYTVLPSELVIKQAGRLYPNETIASTAGNLVWDGSGSAQCGSALFGYFSSSHACIYTRYANPAIYLGGSADHVTFENMTFIPANGNPNGGTDVVDDAQHTIFNNVVFNLSAGTNADYLAMGLVIRGAVSSADAKYELDGISFTSSTYTTSAPTWTPFFYVPNAQDSSGHIVNSQGVIDFKHVSSNQRGTIQYGSGITWNIEGANRQSGIMPLFWHLNGNASSELIKLRSVNIDTDGSSEVSEGSNRGITTDTPDTIDGLDVGNGAGLYFGGFGPAALRLAYSGSTGNLAPNQAGTIQGCELVTGVTMNCNFDLNSYIGPNARMIFPLPAPTNLNATAASGGSLAADTVEVAVSAVGPEGKETIITPVSAGVALSGTCPGSGNCEINITWNAPATGNAATYNVYACYVGRAPLCGVGGVNQQFTGITGTSFTMTSMPTSGISPKSFTQTGQTGIAATYIRGPQMQLPEIAAPSAIPNYDLCYGDSTAHAVKCAFNNGSFFQQPQLICSGQIALSTGAIGSGARGTNTLTCTGLSATTDTISCTFSGDTNAVTGYAPSASGGLSLKTWASTNTINVDQVNDTGSSITPGAATVNCKGIR